MSVSQLIREARSHRWYKQQPVDASLIESLLDVARIAPQARNSQNIRLSIINDDQEMVAKIFNETNQPNMHKVPETEMPKGFVVFSHDESKLLNKDVHNMNLGIVYQNFNLLMQEKGLRCVLIHVVHREHTKAIVGLPEEQTIDFVVAYGYPLKEVKLVDTEDEVSHAPFKDEAGTHNVPKLKLSKQLIIKR